MQYSIVETGQLGTKEYQIYLKYGRSLVSPFHDIPLFKDQNLGIVNMVVEIPRFTVYKLEINGSSVLNPIRHDIKNGEVRRVSIPYLHNYGALPQTWENPNVKDESTGLVGDNDPVDVIEIGSRIANWGDVLQVKVLGAFVLLDEGKTDWKVIAIDVNDPKSAVLRDICEVDSNLLNDLLSWFKHYKSPIINVIGLNEEVQHRNFALAVIEGCHSHWKTLVMTKPNNSTVNCDNLTVNGSPFKKSLCDVMKQICSANSASRSHQQV